MDAQTLNPIVSWMRSTDLLELSFKHGREGFEFRLEGSRENVPTAFPSATIHPVTSPGVGLFRWAPPGIPKRVEEGAWVEKGSPLGLLETGGKPIQLVAPWAGRVVKIFVQEGDPVEYGRPLFFLSP